MSAPEGAAPPPGPPWPDDRPSADAERQPDTFPAHAPRPPSPTAPEPGVAAVARQAARIGLSVVAVLVLLVLALPMSGLLFGLVLPVDVTHPLAWLPQYAVAIAAALAWWMLLRRRSARRLGLGARPRAMGHAVAGFGVGTALMAAVVAAGIALSAWRITPRDSWDVPGIAGWTAVLTPAALYEEILLRGILLQGLAMTFVARLSRTPEPSDGLAPETTRRRCVVAGAVASSLIFATMHMLNPEVGAHGRGPQVVAFLGIAAAGILLCAAFLWTGDLWLAAGLHFGWNWAQSILFGLPVSGFVLPSLLDGHMSAEAPWWAGSAFGPESSIMALAIVALVGIPWLWLARRRPLPVAAER